MKMQLIAAMLLLAAPVSAQRGAVSAVTASSPRGGSSEMVFTITGSNPCPAVIIDFGDGTAPVTHAIRQLPSAISHAFPEGGIYRVRVRGTGNCAGEAAMTVKVAGNAYSAMGRNARAREQATRFAGMDTNGDGMITRSEWQGSEQSFRVHDWNGDGVLQGGEVTAGTPRGGLEPDDWAGTDQFNDWSEQRFRDLDHSGDGRISRQEWHYAPEDFIRADRNRDGSLTMAEFLSSDFDDDRGDRFEYLDINGDGRVERREWHASPEAFNWLDRDNNGILTRAEVAGDTASTQTDLFASLDMNGDQRISPDEWHWSRASFDQRDANRDGVLARNELVDPAGNPTVTVVVDGKEQWTDTGITLREGDRVSFSATGEVQLSGDPRDKADPQGSRVGRTADQGPRPKDPAGALVARIGDSLPVLIGSRTTALRVPQAGRLYLGVNDDHFPDNGGEFRVVISVAR